MGIISNLVIVEVDGPVAQNEIAYINLDGTHLMSEVIKVIGKNVYVQVFESTRGLKVGAGVEFQGHMLEVVLGPGLLERNLDGLENDLDKMEGVFLKRGQYTFPLDEGKKWIFKPIAQVGDNVSGGSWLGEVDENFQLHKIMVPFVMTGEYKVKSIAPEGEYNIYHTVAVVEDKNGEEHELNMIQKWPVKVPVTLYKEKPRPFKLLETGVIPCTRKNPGRLNCWKPA